MHMRELLLEEGGGRLILLRIRIGERAGYCISVRELRVGCIVTRALCVLSLCPRLPLTALLFFSFLALAVMLLHVFLRHDSSAFAFLIPSLMQSHPTATTSSCVLSAVFLSIEFPLHCFSARRRQCCMCVCVCSLSFRFRPVIMNEVGRLYSCVL